MLLDLDLDIHQVFTAQGGLGTNVYLFKEIEPLKILHTGANRAGIENATLMHHNLPANNVVPGSGIAADCDSVDMHQEVFCQF